MCLCICRHDDVIHGLFVADHRLDIDSCRIQVPDRDLCVSTYLCRNRLRCHIPVHFPDIRLKQMFHRIHGCVSDRSDLAALFNAIDLPVKDFSLPIIRERDKVPGDYLREPQCIVIWRIQIFKRKAPDRFRGGSGPGIRCTCLCDIILDVVLWLYQHYNHNFLLSRDRKNLPRFNQVRIPTDHALICVIQCPPVCGSCHLPGNRAQAVSGFHGVGLCSLLWLRSRNSIPVYRRSVTFQ